MKVYLIRKSVTNVIEILEMVIKIEAGYCELAKKALLPKTRSTKKKFIYKSELCEDCEQLLLLKS